MNILKETGISDGLERAIDAFRMDEEIDEMDLYEGETPDDWNGRKPNRIPWNARGTGNFYNPKTNSFQTRAVNLPKEKKVRKPMSFKSYLRLRRAIAWTYFSVACLALVNLYMFLNRYLDVIYLN